MCHILDVVVEEAHEVQSGRRCHQAVSEGTGRAGLIALDAGQPKRFVIGQQRTGLQKPAEAVKADPRCQALEHLWIDVQRLANRLYIDAIGLGMLDHRRGEAGYGGQFIGEVPRRHWTAGARSEAVGVRW